MERCLAEGKGWDGDPTKDFHLPTSCCSHCITCMNFFGTLYNPVLPEGRSGREAACSYPGEMCLWLMLCRGRTWCVAIQLKRCGAALPRHGPACVQLQHCPVMSSLPAEKMQDLCSGGGKTVTLLFGGCGHHLPYGPWVLISISVCYPRAV